MKNNIGSPEPMTMWKKGDANEYKPILHQPSHQLWRDFSALAVKDTEDTRPRIITWLDILKENEIELYKKIRMEVFLRLSDEDKSTLVSRIEKMIDQECSE